MRIPSTGLTKAEVAHAVESARKDDWPWREGKLFAYTFEAGADIEEVGKHAFMAYLTENGLDPTTFPSLRTFENDLVDMSRRHLGGDEAVVGNFTSGGTESIMLAVKTARDYALAHRPGLERPKMLVPITAHAAFHKAGHYLGVEVVLTAVDPTTFLADVDDIRAKLDDDVVLVVASACSYAHGVVDPVPEIAALAQERGVLCHVDGCMGAFLLPFFRRLGADVPDFDFRVPGVTSMSMDLHKYGLCPKGASVVLYRDESIRKFQLFACSEWTGYTMINTTIQSSKSGGPLAAAWAVLQFVGDDGYMRIAKELYDAHKALVAGIDAIPGLRVMGTPQMSLVGFTSDELSVFSLCDALKAKGFAVQAQLASGPSKENIHMTINPGNTRWIGPFLEALRACVAEVRAAGGGVKPPRELASQLAAMIAADTSGEGLGRLIDSLGGAGGTTPRDMADINALLNELPLDVRGQLLLAFVGRMFTPVPR
jgi:sphinganine-1-phosphate aldolase